MAALPENGTCSYTAEGVTVAFTALYHSRVTTRPVHDEANRTVILCEHTLEVEGYVAGNVQGGGNDATLAQMRKTLTAQGGILVYQSKGFGDLVVNQDTVRDVAWGPVPELLDWKPLGDVYAALVTWRVVTRVPECDLAKYQAALMALNYTSAWSIDRDGFTVLKYSGYLEVPMTRRAPGDRSIPDTADRYRERIQADVPLGFQRTGQDFRLSNDNRRLDWEVTDEEVPAPLPDGATRVAATQTVESQLYGAAKAGQGAGFRVWHMGLDVTVTMARGRPKTDALTVFLAVLLDRTAQLRNDNNKPPLWLPYKMTFGDDVFGRDARFGIELQALRKDSGLSIAEILAGSRLWQPVGTASWDSWKASLSKAGGPFLVRGWAGLADDPANSAIVDLCQQPNPVRVLTPQLPEDGPGLVSVDGPTARLLRTLTPEDSWITYEVRIVYEEESDVVPHRPLLRTAMPPVPSAEGNNTSPGTALSTTGGPTAKDGFRSVPPDNFQRPVQPARRLMLVGRAERLVYRIPPPELAECGGQPVVETSRQFTEGVTGAIFGLPVVQAAWVIRYRLPGQPDGTLPVAPNPVLFTPGDDGGGSSLTTGQFPGGGTTLTAAP